MDQLSLCCLSSICMRARLFAFPKFAVKLGNIGNTRYSLPRAFPTDCNILT